MKVIWQKCLLLIKNGKVKYDENFTRVRMKREIPNYFSEIQLNLLILIKLKVWLIFVFSKVETKKVLSKERKYEEEVITS